MWSKRHKAVLRQVAGWIYALADRMIKGRKGLASCPLSPLSLCVCSTGFPLWVTYGGSPTNTLSAFCLRY